MRRTLTAEQQADLKATRYGMYTPDGNLRVAQHIINLINEGHELEGRVKDLDFTIREIQDAVASDGHWCAEARDTAVYDAIYEALMSVLDA